MKPVSQAGSNFSAALLDASPPPPLCANHPLASRYFSFFFFFFLLLHLFFVFAFVSIFNFLIFVFVSVSSSSSSSSPSSSSSSSSSSLFSPLALASFSSYAFSLRFFAVFVHAFAPRRRNEPATTLLDLHFLISSIPTSGLLPADGGNGGPRRRLF